MNGGVAEPGPGESEVLLDVDTVMLQAPLPGTSYVVFDAPNGTSFGTMFSAMIDDGVTVVSNSWSECEDQMSQAEVQGIDTILQSAAAGGISVFNGSGDSGTTCLDGSANTIGVPADSPNATTVGGTSPAPGPGLHVWKRDVVEQRQPYAAHGTGWLRRKQILCCPGLSERTERLRDALGPGRGD